jgi:hypothetical protein
MVVLKPAPSVVWDQTWRALLIGIPGLAVAWGAGSAGKPVGVIVGIPLVGLATFMILNKLTVRVRLENGVLSSRSLFERHSVAVSDITAIVPVLAAALFGAVAAGFGDGVVAAPDGDGSGLAA